MLSAQAEAIRESGTSAVMVSPDSLISKPIDFLIGDHDLTLLTRLKPKPIVNSIIAFKPSLKLFTMWLEIVQAANNLPASSREWGADIDAVVDRLSIKPAERGRRMVDDVEVKFKRIDRDWENYLPLALSQATL